MKTFIEVVTLAVVGIQIFLAIVVPVGIICLVVYLLNTPVVQKALGY